MSRNLLAGALLLTCLAAQGADAGKRLEQVRPRIESPTPNKNEAADLAFLRVLSSDSSPFAGRAAAILAFHHRRKGTSASFKDTLKKFALQADGAWNFDQRECCLEYARLIAKENLPKAVRAIERIGQGGSGLLKMLAAETGGDVMLDTERPQQAVDYYRMARRFYWADEYLQKEELAQFAYQRIKRNLGKARRILDVRKYGEEFVLYREAEEARKNKRYEKALAKYDEIKKRFPDTVFALASRMYGGYCLERLGKLHEAGRRWAGIANGEPWALYRGEALAALGELRLKRFLEVKSAVQWFKKADEWLSGVEAAQVDLSRRHPPARSAEVTAAPQKALGFDDWGNVHEPRPNPGALVNRLTAPWYLDRLRLRVFGQLAFLHLFFGQPKEAREYLEKYRRLDKVGEYTEKLRFGSFHERMIWNIEHNQGCLRALPEEARVFTNAKRRLVMFMGDLAYEQENLEAAKEQYYRLLKGEFGRPSQAEKAYLWFAAACCEGSKDRDKAVEMLSVFEKKWRNTPTAPRALFYWAKFLASGKSNTEKREQAIRLYDLIERRYPGSGYDDEAVYLAGLWTRYLGRRAEAERRFARYKAKFPNGYHKDHLAPEFLDLFMPRKEPEKAE